MRAHRAPERIALWPALKEERRTLVCLQFDPASSCSADGAHLHASGPGACSVRALEP